MGDASFGSSAVSVLLLLLIGLCPAACRNCKRTAGLLTGLRAPHQHHRGRIASSFPRLFCCYFGCCCHLPLYSLSFFVLLLLRRSYSIPPFSFLFHSFYVAFFFNFFAHFLSCLHFGFVPTFSPFISDHPPFLSHFFLVELKQTLLQFFSSSVLRISFLIHKFIYKNIVKFKLHD